MSNGKDRKMSSNLRFELKLKEIPVTLVESGGKEVQCFLRELDGSRKGSYLDQMSDMMDFEDGEVKKIKSFSGLETSLLALCLYEDGKLMSAEKIGTFPATVQTALFNEAQKLSGLEAESKAEAKNDSKVNGTTGTD